MSSAGITVSQTLLVGVLLRVLPHKQALSLGTPVDGKGRSASAVRSCSEYIGVLIVDVALHHRVGQAATAGGAEATKRPAALFDLNGRISRGDITGTKTASRIWAIRDEDNGDD